MFKIVLELLQNQTDLGNRNIIFLVRSVIKSEAGFPVMSMGMTFQGSV